MAGKNIKEEQLSLLSSLVKTDIDKALRRLPYGTVTSTSSTVVTATVEGFTRLETGSVCVIKNGATASASGWTLNVNGLGAKEVYVTTAASTRSTTQFAKYYTCLFIYDGTLDDGNGGWRICQLFNSNTTYSSMSQTEADTGTATTARSISAKVLRTTIENALPENLSDLADDATHRLVTDAEKTKLAGIAEGAEVNVQSDWSATDSSSDAFIKNKPTIPSKTSELTNDSGFVTSSGITSVTTSGTGNAVTGVSVSGGTATLQKNATFLTEHQDISGKANTVDLADVAFSGDYEDLENKPDTPSVELGNLIRNSGFTGSYETEEVSADTNIDDATMWSDPLRHWTAMSAEVSENASSVSGYACSLSSGSITQSLGTLPEGNYVLSLLVSGTVAIDFCGQTASTTQSTLTRVEHKFSISVQSAGTLSLSGTCVVADIMLVKGTMGLPWMPSEKDNDKALKLRLETDYLLTALRNLSDSTLSGLVLDYLIKVGNYRDDEMGQETGGMSGLVNSGQSPFLWGGGSMEQALNAISQYVGNPSYVPTSADLADMAKFVVTHNGMAILADAYVRGYVHAINSVSVTKGNTESVYGADTLIFRGETIQLDNLPTAAPSTSGRLWNDNGTLKIS